MRIGKLRRRITIRCATLTQNSIGEMVQSWADFARNVPAQIVPANGKEAIQAAQVNAQQQVIVCIRYLPGVSPQMRIIYGTRTFEINSVMNKEERNREMEIVCVEHL